MFKNFVMFIASTDDVMQYAEKHLDAAALESADVVDPLEKFDGISIYGITFLDVYALLALLGASDPGLFASEKLIVEMSEEGPWLSQFSPGFAAVFANLDSNQGDKDRVVRLWLEKMSACEWSLDETREVLDKITGLASQAVLSNRNLYQWNAEPLCS